MHSGHSQQARAWLRWPTKLASATNRAFFVQHACGLPTTPTPCADLMRLCMLDLDAGNPDMHPSHEVHTAMYTALTNERARNASMLAILCYNGAVAILEKNYG